MPQDLKLGVDVGGSKINIALWDGQEIIKRWQSKEVSLKKLKEGINSFDIAKIGIGLPGILDRQTGEVLSSPNLKFLEGVNLKEVLSGDVRLDNDVNCFLRAEAELGAAQGLEHVLGVALGTGIGGAIMVNKEVIYQGAHGAAGEFGQMVVDQGKTWEQSYQANKKDLAEQAKIDSIALANLINIFDPEMIVLGGGGANLPQRRIMEKFILAPFAKKTPVVLAKLGLDAGAIGAALLFD